MGKKGIVSKITEKVDKMLKRKDGKKCGCCG